MGMAASQARLLCLTARIHDVEYQAQAIQGAKVQLATQSDQVYQDYLAAMDAATLTINAMDMNTGASSVIAANFNNLCSRNRVMPAALGANKSYAILNQDGHLVVEDEIEEGYAEFTEAGLDDPYQFALFMMKGGNIQDIGDMGEFASNLEQAEKDIYAGLGETDKSAKLTKLYDKLVELVGEGDDIYDSSALISSGDEEKIKEYEETLAAYRKELYTRHGADIYAELEQDPSVAEDMNSSLFNYFVSIYSQIKACGGCVSINDYDGPEGDASNNTAWLQSMIQSGQFSVEIVTTDSTTGAVELDSTSPSSDTCLAYTPTSTIDNRALAKAEAEYEHKMKQIDKKDQQFDLDLSKLETERSALTTEYESVKKVIEDNVDRTFGIFS